MNSGVRHTRQRRHLLKVVELPAKASRPTKFQCLTVSKLETANGEQQGGLADVENRKVLESCYLLAGVRLKVLES